MPRDKRWLTSPDIPREGGAWTRSAERSCGPVEGRRACMRCDSSRSECGRRSRITRVLQLSSQLRQWRTRPGREGASRFRRAAHVWMTALGTLLISGGLVVQAGPTGANTPGTPSRSTTIALTADETRLVIVNREANSLSIIQVKDANGNDVTIKLTEIGVGQEPRCVAVHPTGRAAYVTNAISGTVSVVDLVLGRVATTIKVGTEP